MTDADLPELIGWLLSSFAVGLLSSILLRVFRRAAGYVR